MSHRFWIPLWLPQIYVSYEQQNSYITIFWNGGSYYLVEILLAQIHQ